MPRFTRILALAAALVAVPTLAPAADLPAVVVQVQPVGKVLADVKAGAKMVAGDAAAKQIDAWLDEQLGDKGFEGLDLTKPILAYPILKTGDDLDKPSQMVLVAPVTGEQEFIDFLRRTKSTVEPVEGKKGLYRVANEKAAGGDARKEPSLLRFHGGYAYAGEVPAEQLDPKNLVPADKLVVAGEKGLVAVRVAFGRLPEETQAKLREGIDKALQELKNAPVPDEADDLKKRAAELGQRMAARYLAQVKEADEGISRLLFDTSSGEVSLEFALTGRDGTSLAADIRGRKPTANRFAALVGKDAAAGLLWTFPLLKTEVGEILALGFEEGATKGLDQQDEKVRPLLKELAAGAVRTVRAGELDVGAAVTGPDADGQFAAVAAVSFADPSKVEKEIRDLFEKAAPPEAKQMVTFDAAKAGGTSIHVVALPPGALPPDVKGFGDAPKVGVAFAPKGIYLAFGPNPVAALKPVVGSEPKPARLFDLAVNPSRAKKLAAAAAGEQAAEAAKVLGDADERLALLFADLTGGDELRLQLGFNLKLLGPAVGQRVGAGGAGDASK